VKLRKQSRLAYLQSAASGTGDARRSYRPSSDKIRCIFEELVRVLSPDGAYLLIGGIEEFRGRSRLVTFHLATSSEGFDGLSRWENGKQRVGGTLVEMGGATIRNVNLGVAQVKHINDLGIS
jgi:hypothetical protein